MTSNSNTRQPSLRIYAVKGGDANARWIEVGAAWADKDGNGFSLRLEAMPIGGRFVMREIAPAEPGGQQ